MSYALSYTITRPDKTVPFFKAYIERQPADLPARIAFQALAEARNAAGFTETSKNSADGLVCTQTYDYGSVEAFEKFRAANNDDMEIVKTARSAYEASVGITRSTKIQ